MLLTPQVPAGRHVRGEWGAQQHPLRPLVSLQHRGRGPLRIRSPRAKPQPGASLALPGLAASAVLCLRCTDSRCAWRALRRRRRNNFLTQLDTYPAYTCIGAYSSSDYSLYVGDSKISTEVAHLTLGREAR
jgi:hypothetical protein